MTEIPLHFESCVADGLAVASIPRTPTLPKVVVQAAPVIVDTHSQSSRFDVPATWSLMRALCTQIKTVPIFHKLPPETLVEVRRAVTCTGAGATYPPMLVSVSVCCVCIHDNQFNEFNGGVARRSACRCYLRQRHTSSASPLRSGRPHYQPPCTMSYYRLRPSSMPPP
eukprot:COSAG01_NODE_4534_length_4945_cov_171.303756_3_plen_168_part_00